MEIRFSYKTVPTIKEFSDSDRFIRGLMGPFGCVSGDTEIVTEQGLVQISRIDRPMLVLSWNERTSQFERALSGGAFPKGEDYLYRVSTRQGVFEAAGHHRVLCADGTYRQVSDLQSGDVLGCFPCQTPKSALGHPLASHANDQRWKGILEDWMGRYAESARQYGQQLRSGSNNGQVTFPSPGDAQALTFGRDWFAAWRMDGLWGQSQGHTLSYRLDGLKRTDGFCHVAEPLAVGAEDQGGRALCGRIWGNIREGVQARLRSNWGRLRRVFSVDSYRGSISEKTIVSVERSVDKKVFWDLQVADNNNYVTADGTIHHNSGKSSGCVIEMIKRGLSQQPGVDGIRRTRWAIIRNTYQQLRDTSIKTFHDWVPPSVFGKWNQSQHTYTITAFENTEIEVLFRALDRPDQVDNLLSLELTGAWVNEAREVPWTIIQALQGRVGRFPAKKDGGPSWFGIFMDTNPPDEESWWYRLFEEQRPENCELFKQPSGRSDAAENRDNLPDGYYNNLISSMDEDKARVYVDGYYGFIQEGRPVFPEYNDTTHCQKIDPIPGLPIHRGWDFGLTPACVFTQVTPDGRWFILDELTSDSIGVDRFSDDVLNHSAQRYKGYEFEDYGDPAGSHRAQTDEKTCFQILRGKNINIEPGEQDLTIRIESVKKPLNTMVAGKPGLQVDPKCRMVRKGFQGRYKYRRMMTSEEKYTDKPEKNDYSHPHDALQYIATKLFGGLVRNKSKPKYHEDEFVAGSLGWMA